MNGHTGLEVAPAADLMSVPTYAAASKARGDARLVSSIALVLCLCWACENERPVLPAPGDDASEEARPEAPTSSSSAVAVAVGELEAYPLDGLSRALDSRNLDCPEVKLVEHAGRAVAFAPPARVVEPFVSRLIQFEEVVRAASMQVYARAPSRILIAASYGCRSVSGDSQRLSEHALGNAIDVSGFVFDESPGWPDTPSPLPGAFEVRLERHWKNKGDPAIERHARFLDIITRELVERRVFRTLLGPSHPEHADHFHFDMAPSDYVHL